MGQKVHPFTLRLGIIRGWQSQWMGRNKTDWRKSLHEDVKIRTYLRKVLKPALVKDILIERNLNNINITIVVARPGIVIGRKGEGMDKLKIKIEKFLNIKKDDEKGKVLKISVKSVENPDTQAVIVAQNIAEALVKRVPFRRVAKQTLDRLSQFKEVKGAKIQLAGRLDGADMARTEFFPIGSIPLQTIRADVDYAREKAITTHGTIGIKVWIYKGQVFKEKKVRKEAPSVAK